MREATPETLIVMRSRNAEDIIAQALSALFSQEFRDFELLVVDSGFTDRTCTVAREYPCCLIEIEAKSYFPGSVLNMTVKQAHGDIVVFRGSDAVPLTLETMRFPLNTFDDPAVQATFARQVPGPDAENWVPRDYARSLPDAEQAVPMIPVRRAVYFWVHYRDHRFDEGRRASGNRNAGVGQEIVLARHDE